MGRGNLVAWLSPVMPRDHVVHDDSVSTGSNENFVLRSLYLSRCITLFNRLSRSVDSGIEKQAGIEQ